MKTITKITLFVLSLLLLAVTGTHAETAVDNLICEGGLSLLSYQGETLYVANLSAETINVGDLSAELYDGSAVTVLSLENATDETAVEPGEYVGLSIDVTGLESLLIYDETNNDGRYCEVSGDVAQQIGEGEPIIHKVFAALIVK